MTSQIDREKVKSKIIQSGMTASVVSRAVGKSSSYLGGAMRSGRIDNSVILSIKQIFNIDLTDCIVKDSLKTEPKKEQEKQCEILDYERLEDSVCRAVMSAGKANYKELSLKIESTIYCATLSALRKAFCEFTQETLSGLSKEIKTAIIDGYKHI